MQPDPNRDYMRDVVRQGANDVATDRVTEAVNYLIDAPDYSARAQEMTRSIEAPRDRVDYTGSLACLNALLDLGAANRDAFERILKLVETKRKENPSVSKRDYQRDIMRDRRKRMAKAMLLHEARQGPLRGEDRTKEMASIRARWAKAKAEFLVMRETVSAADRLDATRDFWAMVDRQLDANVASLHRTQAVA
jgi:hypothetical protein